MALATCIFQTERLEAREWHSLSNVDPRLPSLADIVAAMLTESVTRALPISWQGEYDAERAREWIAERDQEGTTLLVTDRSSRQEVGLVILSEAESGRDSGTDVRLGYLLSEGAWGKGFATELVAGLASWCGAQSSITSISAGADRDNLASRRVLEKAGFRVVQDGNDGDVAGLTYRLNLR
ncbi:MAG: GNAT family N-acetyltransferase [Chloroflexi bacterium]|nr:GNAT family N-acetyltransferase [Chloroflexota bacterium]